MLTNDLLKGYRRAEEQDGQNDQDDVLRILARRNMSCHQPYLHDTRQCQDKASGGLYEIDSGNIECERNGAIEYKQSPAQLRQRQKGL